MYDITEYLNYGEDNLICVRADATLEEGWFYEGAGIYRHVWLNKTAPLHVAPFGTFVHSTLAAPFDKAKLTIETTVENSGLQTEDYRLCISSGMPTARKWHAAKRPVSRYCRKTASSPSVK